jgi:hypothetical protein
LVADRIEIPIGKAAEVNCISFKNRNSLTWFTVCNTANGVERNDQNDEICIAGLRNKRLFYDAYHDIFMVLDATDQRENRHFNLNLNLIENLETNPSEKVFISCSRGGNLHLGYQHIGFGSGTMLQMSE